MASGSCTEVVAVGRAAARAAVLVAVAGGGCAASAPPGVARAPVAGAPGPTASPAASAAAGAPCTAGPSLEASALYRRFERHAGWWSEGDEAPPPEPFGTCTVHRGELRAADGGLVAGLGCGVTIHVPGIRDDLGLELGARGRDVLARWTAPRGRLVCIGNGPDQTRCRFDRADDGDPDHTAYVVAGGLGAVEALAGAAAEAFFAPREIVEIWHSVWCH